MALFPRSGARARALGSPSALVGLTFATVAAGGSTLGLALAFGGCGSSGSDVAAPTPDAAAVPDGAVDDDAGGLSLTYAPKGCAYTVTPPASRGFVDLALDDVTVAGAAGDAAPLRVRLGLGGGTTLGAPGYANPATSAVFTWETAAKNRAAKVRLGITPAALDEVHAGYVWTTPPPSIGFGADEPETHMHEVHVCGLAAGTTYYYQVGGGAPGAEVWSATQSFTTVPTTGTVTVGVFGDSRDQVSTWQAVHSRMRDAAINLSIITGDVIDFGTQESAFATWLDAVWKDPADPSKFLTLGQQTMVTIAGNHENDSSQFYGNFALPGDGDRAEQLASFDLGSAHVALVDDQPIAILPKSDAAKAILDWLDADLTAADAARASHPFVIVATHRGLFTTSKHAADSDVIAARAALVPLFDKHHVDLVLNGHEHEYERSKPLRAGADPSGAPVVAPAGQGTVYVVNAGAGAESYATGADPGFREKSAGYGAGTGYIGCYGLLTLEAKKVTLSAYMLKAGAGPDDLVDTVELTK